MALAGHAVVLRSADTDAAGDVIGGINNIDWEPAADLLETTDFSDGQYRERSLVGLIDTSCTLSGHYLPADTGQARLLVIGALVWVRFLTNGTTGLKAPFRVESTPISGAYDGDLQVTINLKQDAAAGNPGTV